MRFECLPGCALCCSYKVALLPGDEERIEGLGYQQTVFACDGALRKDNGFCVFLETDKRCSIHEGRPGLCRSFPFYLEDDGSIDVDLSCPGLGRGPEVEPAFDYAAGGKLDSKTTSSIPNYLPFEQFRKTGLHWLSAVSKSDALGTLLQSARDQMRRHNRIPISNLGSLFDIVDGVNTHLSDEGIVTYPFLLLGDKLAIGEHTYPLTEGEMPREYMAGVLDYIQTWFGRYVFYRFCLACSMSMPAIRPMGIAFQFVATLTERIADIRTALSQRWKRDDTETLREAIRAIDGRLRTRCRAARIHIIEQEK